jgi:tRNA threonylcarbamoyladenosine biosynthesis protein TsaB
MKAHEKLLLLDTVGANPGAVLVENDRVMASARFPPRSASAVLLSEIRRMLASSGLGLRDLSGIGVVTGPGSFTGVRIGLAAAKGLCEAAGLPLAAISRLALLAEAADLKEGYAALDAGRGMLYVRELHADGEAREFLTATEDFRARAEGSKVVVTEDKVAAMLAELQPVVRSLSALDLLAPVRRLLAAGGTDLELADANYVHPESEIYPRSAEKTAQTK